MKAVILYWSPTVERFDHQPIVFPGGDEGFIRVEVVEAKDLSDALDMAKPTGREVVLNTVEHPGGGK